MGHSDQVMQLRLPRLSLAVVKAVVFLILRIIMHRVKVLLRQMGSAVVTVVGVVAFVKDAQVDEAFWD